MKTTIFFLIFLFPIFIFSQENKHKDLYAQSKVSEKISYEINLENEDSIITRHEYFDTIGNLTKTLVYKEGTLHHKYEYTYVNSELVKKNYLTNNDDVGFYFTYRYDFNGNLIEVKQFDSNSKLIIHNHFKYNKKNLKTHFIIHFLDSGNPPYLVRKYKYTPNGNLRQVKHYKPKNKGGGNNVKYLYKYIGNDEYHYQITREGKELISKSSYNEFGGVVSLNYSKEVEYLTDGIFSFLDNSKLIETKYNSINLPIETITSKDNRITKKELFVYKLRLSNFHYR